MSDPIRTRRRGVERRGEGRKWRRIAEGRRKEEGEKFEKGERGDVVIPPRPL